MRILKFFKKNKLIKPIIITPGEPSGIGPDLVIQIAKKNWSIPIVVCACPNLIQMRAKKLGISLSLKEYFKGKNILHIKKDVLNILPISTNKTVKIGKLSAENVSYILKTLKVACDRCIKGEFSALVTGPVNKGIINSVKNNFIGHTEFFARRTQSKVVMMLARKNFRIALMTTHLPLKKVVNAINKNKLYNTIQILDKSLKEYFKISNPNIFVCGINPHAGESGYIGDEEIKIIIPTLKKVSRKGIKVFGPLSADTIFTPKYLKKADVILTMYHDQGLPVIKYRNFGKIVNITLGLPFIRTSVDHGTALELAGSGKNTTSSLEEAIKMAIRMSNL